MAATLVTVDHIHTTAAIPTRISGTFVNVDCTVLSLKRKAEELVFS